MAHYGQPGNKNLRWGRPTLTKGATQEVENATFWIYIKFSHSGFYPMDRIYLSKYASVFLTEGIDAS